MKLTKVRIAAILLTFAVHGLPLSPVASAQDIATPAGMQKGLISDPVYNMNAYEVFYPTGWHFQGTLLQGTKCKAVPFPVFRAASHDGLSVFERMPRVDLVYGNNPDINSAQSDCLKISGPISAQQYLKHLAQTMKVDYVGDEQVPQDIIDMTNKNNDRLQQDFAAKYKAQGIPQPKETVQLARAVIRYKNGSFTIKGLLAATMDCVTSQGHTNPRSPLYTTTQCFADVRYEHAPEDRYQAAISLLDPRKTGAASLTPWVKAWTDNLNRQTTANIQQIQRQGAQNIANIKANGEQFRASQAVRQRTHDEFIATMQQGTDNSMRRTQEAGNARQTAASDMVDYALDRQTVRDPNTGQISKVSNATYTWVDSTGKSAFQTNYVNDDPNGSISGTWTRQTVVHGDGTPK
jgi:hypothetical protein